MSDRRPPSRPLADGRALLRRRPALARTARAWSPTGTPGAFRLAGRLLDGAGAPVPDALVETWQADPAGRFPRPGDRLAGFGRCPTDAEGRFFVVTVKPGPVPDPAAGGRRPMSS